MRFGTSWKSMDDADLVRAMARGKDRAFRELVERHQTAIYSYAFRFAGVKEEAEDAVQETFLRLFAHRESLDSSKSIKAYLFKVCRNLLIDGSRKKRFTTDEFASQVDPAPSPHESLSAKEREAILIHAIHTLPENQRTAMVLRHTEELSYTEIADVMNTSISAVESLLVRGRRTLKSRLHGALHTEPSTASAARRH